MTVFIILCVCMVIGALAWLVVPLLRAPRLDSQPRPIKIIILLVVLLPLGAAGLYARLGQWQAVDLDSAGLSATQHAAGASINELKQRLETHPDDIEVWLLLASQYIHINHFSLAAQAYRHATQLTQGKNVDALMGLAEALILMNEDALSGEAGQLVEQALLLEPQNPKILWYGGLSALYAENLRLAHDRFQLLLQQNPPEEIRATLQRQVQDLAQQLASEKNVTAHAGDATALMQQAHQVQVHVNLSSTIKITEPLTLFVLARTPGQGGPPLAVARHTSAELPLSITLTAADAMLPTHTIDGVEEIELVARLSKSGNPIGQSGDYFGRVVYSFTQQGAQGSVAIEINQVMP